MGVIDDFKTEKNINLIFTAASKMIKDKYYDIKISDSDLLNIINSIKITICSDVVLIKKIVKLMELNKIALSKVKDHFDDIINKKNEPEIIEINEDKIDNIKYDSEQLLLKVLELEEKRNAANSLANLQKDTQENKFEPIIVSQPSNIDINLKIIEKLELLSKEKKKIKSKSIVINSYNRDWINNPYRNKLSFSINIDLQKHNIKIDKLILPKNIKDKTPYITMSIGDSKFTQKLIFILKSSNSDNKWDTWENANTDNDNLLLINTKNWHINFTDFINNELDMGADGINIIEIKEKQNNEFDLTIDNGNKKLYSDFGVCNIYDNLLIKTNNGDNIQCKILNIDDNILTVYIENIEKKELMNASLLNYKEQYSIIMSYYQKL
uniref:Uncharacterized protein n=1 Tax=Virus NIOZ-UU159 TaxID=2763270 RepID=A0A7S9SU79_9VIRU|nr:MAG: hypothetical protein NIOZUU159_00108 [Virus NIOZ-UU159]|tara:strand:+ start:1136 stop:2278 length:1143 start_codon:yes stop_codon:yes gene_type:complete